MSNRDLQRFARLVIGKTLGVTVAAKNINIEDSECDWTIPSYLRFTVLGFDTSYYFRELPNGSYKFSISRKCGMTHSIGVIDFILRLEDLED